MGAQAAAADASEALDAEIKAGKYNPSSFRGEGGVGYGTYSPKARPGVDYDPYSARDRAWARGRAWGRRAISCWRAPQSVGNRLAEDVLISFVWLWKRRFMSHLMAPTEITSVCSRAGGSTHVRLPSKV